MGHRYPKRTQLKYTKQRYRVRNWPQYEAGLRRRGDLTLWFSEEAIAAWQAPTGEKTNSRRVGESILVPRPSENLSGGSDALLSVTRGVPKATPFL